MSEVDEKEINKGIALYMGVVIHEDEKGMFINDHNGHTGSWSLDELGFDLYTESLDSLVPVIEQVPFSVCIYTLNGKAKVETPFGKVDGSTEELPQLAAGEIYKAIKALEGRV